MNSSRNQGNTDQIAPETVHETVVQLIGLFAEVATAGQWMCSQASGAAFRVR